MKNSILRNSMFVTLLVAGLGLASCGSNKTEGDASATDTISSGTTETMTTDTVSTVTDTVAPVVNDTVAP